MFGSDVKAKVGVYIDLQNVYVAEVSRSMNQIDVVRSNVTPLGSGVEGFSDDAAISRSVRQALEAAGISEKQLALTLPFSESLVRFFEMPLLPKKEWANAVRFEALKYIPFDTRELYYDFQVFPDRAQKKLRVVFLGAKRPVVERLVSAVERAGVQVIGLEAAPLSLMRHIAFNKSPGNGGTQALVDIHEDGILYVVISREGIFLMARDSAQAAPLNTESFSQEIRLSFNSFSKNFKNQKIEEIVLNTDPEGPFSGWQDLLAREYSVPVAVDTLSRAQAKTRQFFSGMSIAIGRALSGVMETKAMNILPKAAAPAPTATTEADRELWTIFLKRLAKHAVAIAGLWALATIGAHTLISVKQKSLSAEQALTATLSGSLALLDKKTLELKEAELNRRLTFFKDLADNRVYWTLKMNELSKAVKADIRLSSLYYVDAVNADGQFTRSLRMEGFAFLEDSGQEVSSVNRFVGELKENPIFMRGFSDIRLGSLNRTVLDERGAMKFSLECS